MAIWVKKENLARFWDNAKKWVSERFVAIEEGKGLSTNDYTTEEKEKLAGIEEGAEANVQPDWNETSIESAKYIRHKPTLVTAEKDGLMSKEDYTKLAAFKEATDYWTAAETQEVIDNTAHDYNTLTNKPTLNGTTIEGDMDEIDPTVPDWAKEDTKPSYTASEVGAVDENSAISISSLLSLWDSV